MKISIVRVFLISFCFVFFLPVYGSSYHYRTALSTEWIYDKESCQKGFYKKEFLSLLQDGEFLDLEVFFLLKTPTPNSEWMTAVVSWDESVDYSLPFHIEKISILSHYSNSVSEILYEQNFQNFITVFPNQEFKFDLKSPKEKPSLLEVKLWGGFQ